MKPLRNLFVSLCFLAPACTERVPLEIPSPPSGSSAAVRLVAHPNIVHPGDKIVLRWSAPAAKEVTLEQAVDPMEDVRAKFELIGTFPPTGTLSLTPSKSVTYIVTCGNEVIGCSSAAVHILVK